MELQFTSRFGSFMPMATKQRPMKMSQTPPYPAWSREKPRAEGHYWVRPAYSKQLKLGAGVLMASVMPPYVIIDGERHEMSHFTHFAGPLSPPERP